MLLEVHEEFDHEVAQFMNVGILVAEVVVDVFVVYEDGSVFFVLH